jgi:hypothetical protein
VEKIGCGVIMKIIRDPIDAVLLLFTLEME